MSRKIFLLSVFLLLFLQLSAQWTQIPTLSGSIPNDFTRTSSGIYCASGGGLYFSNNEGATWSRVQHFEHNFVGGIKSFSDTIVVVYIDESAATIFSVYSTVSFDGGASWSAPTYLSAALAEIRLQKFNSDLIATSENKFYRSKDFGLTWMNIPLPSNPAINSMQNNDRFVLINGQLFSGVLCSFVLDTSYTINRIDLQDTIQGKVLVDSMVFGYYPIASGYYEILKTGDLGQTWDPVLITDAINGFRIIYDHDSLFYPDLIYRTHYSLDFGLHWGICNVPTSLIINPSIFLQNGDLLGGCLQENYQLEHYYMAGDSLDTACVGIPDERTFNIFCGDNRIIFTGLNQKRSTDSCQTWQVNGYNSYSTISLSMGDTLYGTSFDGIWRSYDGGVNWTNCHPVSGFIYSLVKKGNRLYSSGSGLIYSDDYGDTWHPLNAPTGTYSTCGSYIDNDGHLLVYENHLYLATYYGVVFKMDSTDAFWTEINCLPYDIWSSNLGEPYLTTVGHSILFACDSTLLVSNDEGVTWLHPLMQGIPHPTYWYESFTPTSLVGDDYQLLGVSQNSIYVSTDQGNSWTLFDHTGKQFTPVELGILNGELYATTNYKGLWKYDNYIFNSARPPVINSVSTVTVSPNPATTELKLVSDKTFENALLQIYSYDGKLQGDFLLNGNIAVISVSDFAPGIYFGVIENKNLTGKTTVKFAVAGR